MKGMMPRVTVCAKPNLELSRLGEGSVKECTCGRALPVSRVEDEGVAHSIDQPRMKLPTERQLCLPTRNLYEAGISHSRELAGEHDWVGCVLQYVRCDDIAKRTISERKSLSVSHHQGLAQVESRATLEIVGHILVDHKVGPWVR